MVLLHQLLVLVMEEGMTAQCFNFPMWLVSFATICQGGACMGMVRTHYALKLSSHMVVRMQQAAWNAAMSAGRISVERGFASVSRLWAQVNFVPLQKTLQTQSGKTYLVAVVLHNMHNCCRPNQISQYFDCSPQTLEQYCGIEDMHH